MPDSLYEPVKPDVSFPKLEEEVLAFWRGHKTFEKSLEKTAGGEPYTFYDGPPFATGLPHYGHLLAGTLKDVVPRWQTMKGRHVARRFGWDCHGLPVEYEIMKKHDLTSNKQIRETMGVGGYNAECRGSVTRYVGEWRKTVERMGRWVDMDRPYFTMDKGFMQSVWWVFKRLWDQDLVYKGYKVVPYSVGVSTALSNFEANLNYKEVQDPAITVKFKRPLGGFFLAWTTTPWTLPSNLALAVGAGIDYVEVKHAGESYILAKDLVPAVFGKKAEVETLSEMKGADLVGAAYEPLFDFFADKKDEGAFKVILADHVTTDAGTGIVHMAPAYGEEDYLACQKAGLPIVNPVDDDGMFTDDVGPWSGVRVKEADKDIIKALKDAGKIFKQETIVHSYPFCWRSDTPLIYKAVETWFVRVEAIKDRILAANAKTRWVPETLRDGRFGKWLEGARDWAVSRNRFWGTPLPIWTAEDGTALCVGSIEELKIFSGVEVEDLHLDKLPAEFQHEGKTYRHVGSVLDCWFESGSMPYAQVDYMGEDESAFRKRFPAEFIAEGLDQTRGWFYTLMVLSTALFDEPAFKNVVVNGLILAEDGKKMSKSLRNYPDPNDLLNRVGADAIRLYMINSPVVRAQELRFSEKGVRDVVRLILLKWWNAYGFLVNLANVDGFKPRGDFAESGNILDRWVLSKLNTLIAVANAEMDAYRLYNVVPPLLKFIDELTNTYVRLNRRRFYASGADEDKRLACETLFHVLTTLSKLMAPFAPFISEATYRNLAKGLDAAEESVHLCAFPEEDASLRDAGLEDAVEKMEEILLLGRNVREKIKVPVKVPLKTLTVIHHDEAELKNIARLESYLKEELNVRAVAYDPDEGAHVNTTAKPNFGIQDVEVKKRLGKIAGKLRGLGAADIAKLRAEGSLAVAGETIRLEEVLIERSSKGDKDSSAASPDIAIEFDPSVDEEQKREGLSRTLIRAIQAARKNADLRLDDRIELQLACANGIREVVESFRERIMDETLCARLELVDAPKGAHTETVDVDGASLTLALTPVKATG